MSNRIHHGKVALVTGSARRIGAALIEGLHVAGYNVVVHYRHSKQEALALVEKCCTIRPDSALAIQADLDQSHTMMGFIQTVCEKWQRLDVVINNASQYFPTMIGNTIESQWLDLLKSNLMAPFFIAQAALPFLQKTQGCIINMSDSQLAYPPKNYSAYLSAKAGLNMLTRALAAEFAPDVRVNAIALTSTLWPEGDNQLTGVAKEKILQTIPLRRQASLTEITQTVLFLIENKFITGQIITVDGGRSL